MASLMEIMQLCRLCLVKDQVNIPIFEEQGDIRQIFLKISACLPVKVSREDNLPKKICDGCSYKLEILYQFWNTSANSEKQLLKWLSQIGVEKNSTEKVAVTPAQPHSSLNSDGVVLKQEIVDLADTHSVEELAPDDLDDSNDAQDYILQQQQLPYQPFQFQQDGFTDGEATASASTASATITSETVEAAPKRKRRAAAMKALPPHIDSEEEDEDDVDMVETKIAKTEEQSDDSGAEDPEPTAFVGLPSTSTDNEQPGPSGVGKGSTEAPSPHQRKSKLRKIKVASPEVSCYKKLLYKILYNENKQKHNLQEGIVLLGNLKNLNTRQFIPSKKMKLHLRNLSLNKVGSKLNLNSRLQSPEACKNKNKIGRSKFKRKFVIIDSEDDETVIQNEQNEVFKETPDDNAANQKRKADASEDESVSTNRIQSGTSDKGDIGSESGSILKQNLSKPDEISENDDSSSYTTEVSPPKGDVLNLFGKSYKQQLYNCTLCCETFVDSFKFKRHTMVHKMKNDEAVTKHLHTCYICTKKFSDRSQLWSHMRTHGNNKFTYRCPKCNEPFRASRQLHLHKINCAAFINANNSTENDTETFSCPRCNLQLKNVFSLQYHKLSCQGGSQSSEATTTSNSPESILKYRCNVCKKKFADVLQMRRHKNLHFFHETASIDSFKCCGEVFLNHDTLFLHMKKKFSLYGNSTLCDPCYFCNICSIEFSDHRDWYNHYKGKHKACSKPKPKKRESTQTSKQRSCNICLQKFDDDNKLKEHKLNCKSSGESESTTNDLSSLGQQIEQSLCNEEPSAGNDGSSAEKTVYRCDICDDEFEDSAALLEHEAFHMEISTPEKRPANMPDLSVVDSITSPLPIITSVTSLADTTDSAEPQEDISTTSENNTPAIATVSNVNTQSPLITILIADPNLPPGAPQFNIISPVTHFNSEACQGTEVKTNQIMSSDINVNAQQPQYFLVKPSQSSMLPMLVYGSPARTNNSSDGVVTQTSNVLNPPNPSTSNNLGLEEPVACSEYPILSSQLNQENDEVPNVPVGTNKHISLFQHIEKPTQSVDSQNVTDQPVENVSVSSPYLVQSGALFGQSDNQNVNEQQAATSSKLPSILPQNAVVNAPPEFKESYPNLAAVLTTKPKPLRFYGNKRKTGTKKTTNYLRTLLPKGSKNEIIVLSDDECTEAEVVAETIFKKLQNTSLINGLAPIKLVKNQAETPSVPVPDLQIPVQKSTLGNSMDANIVTEKFEVCENTLSEIKSDTLPPLRMLPKSAAQANSESAALNNANTTELVQTDVNKDESITLEVLVEESESNDSNTPAVPASVEETNATSEVSLPKPRIFVKNLSELLDPKLTELHNNESRLESNNMERDDCFIEAPNLAKGKPKNAKKKPKAKSKDLPIVSLKCDDCCIVFKKLRSYRRHMRIAVYKLICFGCEYHTCSVKKLKEHCLTIHKVEHACWRCIKPFNSANELLLHNKIHVCQKCKKTIGDYESHKKTCSGKSGGHQKRKTMVKKLLDEVKTSLNPIPVCIDIQSSDEASINNDEIIVKPDIVLKNNTTMNEEMQAVARILDSPTLIIDE